MAKKFTFLFLSIMLMASVVTNAQSRIVREVTDESTVIVKPSFNRGGIIEKTILTEDFSKFTAGNENQYDGTRLDNPETGVISDEYFNTPGWKGNEIYQAGGCAYIGFSEEYQETGILITPSINTQGAIYINCRMRCHNFDSDIVGYNIVDENLEVIDANVDFIRVTDEWTEVSWFTSAGTENSHIYIYSYAQKVLIDDIEIISLSLPAPTLKAETNISSNSFTANWGAIDDADSYIFKLTAQHTASSDETFYYTNTSFDNVVSSGTISSPEIPVEMEASVENWHIYMPALINEAIGITGKYASNEVFGAVTSPVFDLSSNNGKINLSFKAHADLNEVLIVSLITSEYGYYDVADQKNIVVENEGWNEYSVELVNGTDDAYIEITNFGWGDIFFDDIKLSQSIEEGESKTLIINELEINDTLYKANIDKAFRNDILSYQVAARKNVYSAENKIIGSIDSEYTEAATVTLSEDEAPADETISIGEGEINSYYAPISNYGSSGFSLSQQIYTKDEINKENGTIKSISFHNNSGNSNTRKITVFMSNTVQDAYRDNHDWVEIKESQIVFSGDFTFGAQGEWTTIELQKPFEYNGGNLAISVYDASSSSIGYSGYDSFYSHATDTLRGLYKASSEKINIYNIAEEIYCYELKTSVYTTPANQYYVNDIKFEIGTSNAETPSVPQNLSANPTEESSIALSWTNAKNATSYNVYLGTEKLANVTTTSYLAEGLETNKEYCFSVTALNGEVESEKSAEACATISELIAVEAPKNLSATTIDTSSIELNWDSVSYAASYNVYRNNELIANVTENTYTDTGLQANTEYCYTVTSVYENNDESQKSIEVCGKTMGCVGLEEIVSLFNIYPNPVSDRIYIETEVEVEEITIYDIYGKKLFEIDNSQLTKNRLQLDIEHLNSGTYFIKVNETVKKFIKM